MLCMPTDLPQVTSLLVLSVWSEDGREHSCCVKVMSTCPEVDHAKGWSRNPTATLVFYTLPPPSVMCVPSLLPVFTGAFVSARKLPFISLSTVLRKYSPIGQV